MTPVVYRFIKEGYENKIKIYSNNYNNDINTDYRIRFLNKKYGIRIQQTIDVSWGGIKRYCFKKYQINLMDKNNGNKKYLLIFKITKKIKSIFWITILKCFSKDISFEKLYDVSWCKEFLERNKATLLVFDVSAGGKKTSKYLIQAARDMNIPVLALPNACNITAEKFKYKRNADLSNMAYFNKIAVHRKAFKKHYVRSGLDPKKIKVIGSPRFCDEWHQVLMNNSIFPSFKSKNIDKKLLKVLLIIAFIPEKYLKSSFYTIRTPSEIRENQIQMVKTLKQLRFINLVIKTHPSFNKFEHIPPEINNCGEIVTSQEDTHSLCEWSDIVISTSSSAVLSAFNLKKPVIFPKYIDGAHMAFDEMNCCVSVDNNKKLESVINSIHNHNFKTPYGDENIKKFLDHVTSDGVVDRDVLQGYVDFILSENRN